MKKTSIVLAGMLLVGLAFAACKKAATPPAAPAPTQEGAQTTEPGKDTGAPVAAATITPEEIAGSLSKAVCARMTACEAGKQQPGQPPVNEADCATMMSKDLSQALPEKAKAVSRDQLSTCVASITKATCEELNAPSAPKGCEFMD
ncbi:MAG: hypothetical protein HY543_02025 [Deltaproteobacteria bacterium]|nr:hypothetical protein [Deltaproteobacteria bacterium]